MPYKESKLRSLLKSLSWRIIALLDSIVVVLVITCAFDKCSLYNALAVGFIEFIFKFLVYYFHERVWLKISFIKRKHINRILLKTISWRIVATVMTFVIAEAVIDDGGEIALYIAIIEIFTKSVLYFFHERLWLVLPLGSIRNYFKK